MTPDHGLEIDTKSDLGELLLMSKNRSALSLITMASFALAATPAAAKK
jgi:hypothetical protein